MVTTPEDRKKAVTECMWRIRGEVFDAMKAKRAADDTVVRFTQGAHNGFHEAIDVMLTNIGAMFLSHANKRAELEDRILQLEDQLTRPVP